QPLNGTSRSDMRVTPAESTRDAGTPAGLATTIRTPAAWFRSLCGNHSLTVVAPIGAGRARKHDFLRSQRRRRLGCRHPPPIVKSRAMGGIAEHVIELRSIA